MKINEKILSIPPYISTTWNNIAAIHTKDSDLIVSLLNGDNLTVPDLNKEVIETVFISHSLYIDRHTPQESTPIGSFKNISHGFPNLFDMNMDANILPFKIGDTSNESIEELGSMLAHNPTQANAPELPQEVISKIVAITKIVSPDAPITLPKAETNCNCVHCQISRAINHSQDIELCETVKDEEEVSDEDLVFRQWDICQTGNKLYTVINRLDTKEKYSVYLGQPLGCTCGKPNCEHLLAVLKS